MASLLSSPILIADGTKSVPLEALPPEAWTWIIGEGPQVGDLRKHFEAVAWLYRGVTVRAQTIASLPFAILQGDEEIDHSEDYRNTLGWLPDPFELLYLVEGALTLFGRAYLLKEANVFGRKLGVRWVLPSTIRPRTDPERGVIGYIRTINNRQLPPFDRDDIVDMRLPDFFSELDTARSPAEVALAAADVLLNVDKFAATFFKRGAVKVTVLGVPGSTQKQERERLESWWEKVISGISNAWGAKVINADDVKATTIGEGISELSDTELVSEKREDISTALGIPQSILFSSGVANRSVTEQDELHFYNKTIIPEAQFISRRLNADLFEPQGAHIKFNWQSLPLFQEDEEQRSTSLLSLVNAGEDLLNAYDILGFDLPEEIREFHEAKRLRKLEREQNPPPIPPPFVPQMGNGNGGNGTRRFESDLDKWQRKSLSALRAGKAAAVDFSSDHIPLTLHASISGALDAAQNEDDVHDVFTGSFVGYP